MTTSTSPTSSGIEGRRDLVEEHHAGLHHQRAGDRDPLLLAAGKLMRMLLGLLLEPDASEELQPPLLGFASRHLANPPRRERDVVDRLQVREEVELLEDDPDPLPDRGHLGALAGDLLALEEDPPAVDRLEQVDAAKKRALPAPARPDDDERLAGGHLEVDPVEDDVLAEALVNRLGPDNGHSGRLGSDLGLGHVGVIELSTRVSSERCAPLNAE